MTRVLGVHGASHQLRGGDEIAVRRLPAIRDGLAGNPERRLNTAVT